MKNNKDNVIIFNNLEKACNYRGDKICVFEGNANFKDSNITSLGNLESIGGDADFRKSNVTSLGNLKSIGRDAYFGDKTDLKEQCGS